MEEKKNTMENMMKEHTNLVRLINDGLAEIHTKKMEYLACSADGSPNQEYFKGKADAYEYTYKTFKRILEWTASGSVAAPKEESSTIAYASVMSARLKEYSTTVQGALVRQDLAHVADLLTSMSVRLKEREEALKELLSIIDKSHELFLNDKDWTIIERARKLILNK